MHMRQSLHRGNRTTHARKKERTTQGYTLARTQNSAVTEHANGTGHKPLWNETKLIDRENHWYTREVKEAIQTQPK